MDGWLEGSPPTGDKSIKAEWKGFFRLAFWALACGLLISVYVIVVAHYTARRAVEAPVQDAALWAADKLSQVTVEDPHFGRVGLCDAPARLSTSPGGDRAATVGVNSLFATVRLDLEIGRQLRQPVMIRLAGEDLEQAREAANRLSTRLKEAVQSSYYDPAAGSRSIYQQLFRQLSEQVADGQTLVGLSIAVGQDNSPAASCLTPVPPYTVLTSPWNDHGRYKPGVPVPVPNNQPLTFCALADSPKIINGRYFVLNASWPSVPSAVLVEATYSTKKDGVEQLKRSSACALVGSAPCAPPPSAFVINFPFGVPPQFHRAMDILGCDKWTQAGRWQQAINADVPGNGTLVPLATESGAIGPSQAMAAALYHWLRQMGPRVNPAAVMDLLSAYWTDAAGKLQAMDERAPADLLAQAPQQCNSFLVRDTGARQYAISNQTGPAGLGQQGIHNAFSCARGWAATDLGALPLYVDDSGNCRLPGHPWLDTALVEDFLESLHRTNLSGIQAMFVADQARRRAELALAQLDHDSFVSHEELRAVTSRMGSLGAGITAKGINRPAELLQLRASILQKSLIRQSAEKDRFLRIKELAVRVHANGQKAALRSFEIGLHMPQYVRGGLYRVATASTAGFRLGQRLIFTPHTIAISEDEIYAAAQGGKGLDWMSKEFNVLSQTTISGPPDKAAASAARPLAVVLTSLAACSERQVAPSLYRQSPFTNLGVPLGQLLYYAPDALETGDTSPVCWSVLLRDLVAYSSDRALGLPGCAANPYWCQKHDQAHSACPGLACEFQVRTPLPQLKGTTAGAYLTNPLTHQRIALIPPIPPEMI